MNVSNYNLQLLHTMNTDSHTHKQTHTHTHTTHTHTHTQCICTHPTSTLPSHTSTLIYNTCIYMMVHVHTVSTDLTTYSVGDRPELVIFIHDLHSNTHIITPCSALAGISVYMYILPMIESALRSLLVHHLTTLYIESL